MAILATVPRRFIAVMVTMVIAGTLTACIPIFNGDAALTAKAVSSSATQANLVWNPASVSDASDSVAYYAIYVNNVYSAYVYAPASNCTLQGLQPSTAYSLIVTAVSQKGDWSGSIGGAYQSLGRLSTTYTTPTGTPSGASLGCVNPIGGATDSDGDGLPDWAETNTGVYHNPGDTGTSPVNADTDGDGISDGDETLGTKAGLDLPAMGANPLHKNIFIEADWYQTTYACGYSYSTRPTDAEVARVTSAFATSGVTNPDGSTGVKLVVDYGQGGAFMAGNLVPGDGTITGDVNTPNDSAFNVVKSTNFNANRQGYFHYMLMGSSYSTSPGSSGVAELPGNDFIVSLPNCYILSNTHNGAGHDEELANTMMHELGHNLGLHHGGSNDVNYKPNFNSIMNYRYQGDGIDTSCDAVGDHALSYSVGVRPSLNEANLNELVGVCGSTSYPIDWNSSGTYTNGIAFDLNNNAIYDSYSDYNDWAHLNFGGLSNADGQTVAPTWVVEQPAVHR